MHQLDLRQISTTILPSVLAFAISVVGIVPESGPTVASIVGWRYPPEKAFPGIE
jgi:hypothetical protein